MPPDHTRTALQILLAAALLGAAGDILLHTTPWGLNFGIWVAALGCAALLASPTERRSAAPWLALALVFACFMALRASAFLGFWNFLAVLTCLTLTALRSHLVRLPVATLFRLITGAVDTAFSTAAGSLLLLFGDVRWDSTNHHLKRSRPILIGVVLATPLALVFGTLLTAADPVFASTVAFVFDWDFANVMSHVIVGLAVAWLAAGYLRYLVFQRPSATGAIPEPRSPAFGMVEIGIALGTITLLLTVFVTIQIQYLFGGERLIQDTLGLSYAEYARRGFFEIVAAAALIVPVLLLSNWMLDTDSHINRKSFTALASALLLLVSVVMLSALKRMQLYVDAYGLTEDRLYATAFLLWIAIVLGWLTVTVLRGKSRRFAFGMIVSGLTVLAGLNLLNPSAVIARTNLGRARSGASLDVHHLTLLGPDAAPTILAGVSSMTETDRCQVLQIMVDQPWANQRSDWRSWNLARRRARAMLREFEAAAQRCEVRTTRGIASVRRVTTSPSASSPDTARLSPRSLGTVIHPARPLRTASVGSVLLPERRAAPPLRPCDRRRASSRDDRLPGARARDRAV